jgi:hypothetical protein
MKKLTIITTFMCAALLSSCEAINPTAKETTIFRSISRQEITAIGTCNRQGWCSVKTTLGKYGVSHFPIVGREVCYEKLVKSNTTVGSVDVSVDLYYCSEPQ